MIRLLSKLVLFASVLAIGLGGGLYYLVSQPKAMPGEAEQVVVAQGSGVKSVALVLSKAQVIEEPHLFVWWVRLTGQSGKIKAGNYVFNGSLSMRDVLRLLVEGDVTQSSLRFTEGWNLRQVRAALAENTALKHDTAGMTTDQLAASLGIDGPTPEGWLFPDTYHFSSGLSELQILQRAHQQMEQQLQRAWEERAPGLPFASPYQALIMASIVEKETGLASERPMIAGVFINRLRIGMRLQTDPTVIYGLGDQFDGNLTRVHLQTDTPYNTYTRAGLPPTPIAMPGNDSIYAVLHPADTRALYFVARGDGGHVFSASLAAHNAAVLRYQIKRKH